MTQAYNRSLVLYTYEMAENRRYIAKYPNGKLVGEMLGFNPCRRTEIDEEIINRRLDRVVPISAQTKAGRAPVMDYWHVIPWLKHWEMLERKKNSRVYE